MFLVIGSLCFNLSRRPFVLSLAILRFLLYNTLMLKKYLSIILAALAALSMALPVKAVCPVCVIAVGSCVGLARWLKIDDTISGLWIGGLIVSLIAWTLSWFDKKQWRFWGREIWVVVFYFASVIIPFYYKGFIGHPLNKCGGVDKILLGMTIGSAGFLAGMIIHYFLKKHHGGRVYFPFQKVVMSLIPLAILSAVFYFITKN